MSERNGKAVDPVEQLQEEVSGVSGFRGFGGATQNEAQRQWRRFPTEALPNALANLVREGARSCGVDEAMIAIPGLAVLAGAIGNTYKVRVKDGDWFEPSVVWGVPIASSSSKKSPALDLVKAPIEKKHLAWTEEYNRELDVYEAQLDELKRGDAKPDKPIQKRCIVSDITIDSIAVHLEENPRGLLLIRDELASWIRSFKRYGNADDVSRWLELHRAGLLIVDRKHGDKKHFTIPRAAVSIAGTIQVGTFKALLSKEYRDAGLVARLLVAMPPAKERRWTEDTVGESTRTQYDDLIQNLLALKLTTDKKDVNGGKPRPYVLKMSPGAKRLWVNFYDKLGAKQDDAEGDIAAALGKIEGYTIRFALIHHVANGVVSFPRSDQSKISEASMQAGITLAEWFSYETERVYGLFNETAADEEIRSLLDYLDRKPNGVTPRELHQRSKSKYATAEVAKQALDELVKKGLARWADREAGGRGGVRLASL